jgi:hypothetical protein
VRWLTDDEYPTVMAQSESDDAKKAVTLTVAQADGVKAAPMAIPGTAPKAAAKPAPAPAVDDEDEAPAPKAKAPKTKPAADVDDEPEVRKEAPKATAVPAKKSKLADIVSDWDDE